MLTPAEWRVAEQVRHGMTNRQIAGRMGVSVDAVKFHVSNVLTKLGFLSRLELRQWDGIAKASALYQVRTRSMEQPTVTTNHLELGQIARTTKRFDEARVWYRDVLQLSELYCFGKLAFFDLNGVRLMLAAEEENAASTSILYFRVPDIHATKADFERRGIHFINAPHLVHRHADGTEEWMAAFEDNEGRPLQLMAQVRLETDSLGAEAI